MSLGRRVRVLLVLASVSALGFGALVTSSPPVLASLSACGTTGKYFSGLAGHEGTSVYGARATIEQDNPDLCNDANSPSASSAWAMVAGYKPWNGGYESMYAQAGYVNIGVISPGGEPAGLHKFAQFKKACAPDCGAGNSVAVTWYSTGYPSEPLTYVAKWQASDSRIHMYSNGVDVLQTSYNPIGVWENEWHGEWSAETFHTASDTVGTSSNKVSMWNLQTYTSSGSTVSPTTFFANPAQGSRYYNTITNPSTGGKGLDVWTYPLQ